MLRLWIPLFSALCYLMVGVLLESDSVSGAAMKSSRLRSAVEEDLSNTLRAVRNYYDRKDVASRDDVENLKDELADIELVKTLASLQNYYGNQRGKNEYCTVNGEKRRCNRGACKMTDAGGNLRCLCNYKWTGVCCNTMCANNADCQNNASYYDCDQDMQKEDAKETR